MLIRPEQPSDAEAIRAVHVAAFEPPEPGEPSAWDLVDDLRACDAWLPALSLVAADVATPDTVVGHVVCSRASLDGHPVLGLGPLGVLPARQRSGVGSALMHAVLAAADALDEPLVVLLGHHDYYPRFGFRRAADLGITPPDPQWREHFQARPLTAYHPALRGPFAYPPPFNSA